MQAIQTKIIPATNFRPTRIKAWCARGSITVPYYSLPNEGGFEQKHINAALKLIDKFVKEDAESYGETKHQNPWVRHYATGCLPNGDFAHVFLS